MKLEELINLIKERKITHPKGSYTAHLLKKGGDEIAKKVGEEAVESIIASKNRSKKRLISELSDLFYHLFVLMVYKEISLEDIEEELQRRNKKTKKPR